MSFISFHPPAISFPLFLLALRPDGLIGDCWWNGSCCRDHIDKHSSLWWALLSWTLWSWNLLGCLGSWQHQVLGSGLPGFLCLAWSQNAVFSRACCKREVMINGKNSSVSFRLHDKIDWVLKPYACSFCSILSLCFSFQNMSGIPAWVFFWLRPCLAAICAYCCCCFPSLSPLALQCFPQPLISPKDLCYLLGYEFQNLIFLPVWHHLKVVVKCLGSSWHLHGERGLGPCHR